jgi:hypothetical protein
MPSVAATIMRGEQRVSVRVSVAKNGWHGVRLADERNPHGLSIDKTKARELADALLQGRPANVSTFEGRVLALRGIRLGDTAKWHDAWILSDEARPALARALLNITDKE